MRRVWLVTSSLGIAVAMLSFAIGTQVESAIARTNESVPAIGLGHLNGGLHNVDRTLKGDRLTGKGARAIEPVGASEPKLPEGCVADASMARNAFWVEVPGRCVAMLPAWTPVG